jgi:hypothetical protein
MSPQHECVETVKEMAVEVMREKNALVGRLNAMHQRIVEEEDPVTKVRRKVEWAAEKERSVEALTTIVASLQRVLKEKDRSTHGSTASLRSSASSTEHGASPPSFTNQHPSSVDRDQVDFEITVAANTDPDFSFEASQEVGAAKPRQKEHRASSVPLREFRRRGDDDAGRASPAAYLKAPRTPRRKLATSPQPSTPIHRLPALLEKEPATTPASKAAGVLRSLSREASQLPGQVRTRVMGFSASVLRRVGWPELSGDMD